MSTENTAQTPAPLPGTPEYDAAMAATFDAAQASGTPETPAAGTETPAAETPAKPDWLPEKFWKDGKADYSALAESYKQLESGKGKPATAGEVDPAAAAAATKDDAAEALSSVGLDYAAMSEQYQQDGELSAANREALRKAGIPDAMVDAYVAGQKATAEATLDSIYGIVDGKEKYGEIVTWAKTGLPKAELEAYNKIVEGTDLNATKLAVAGLKARFETANGVDPQLVQATTAPASGGDVFRSNAELVTAMNDPRYARDPAYRNDVIQKLNRSSIM